MSYDQHPWDREDEEIRAAFAKQKQLITELAAALAAKGVSAFLKSDVELLRRAREATKT